MSKLARLIISGIMVASFIFVQAPAQALAGEVEVLHWWTSGGEAAALSLLKKDLEQKGITWKDMPVAGGGGSNAMTVLRARVAAGTAPTAVQMLGFDILDWAKQGVVANLNDMAAQENWDALIPEALKKFSKYDGKWIAAPVNVHSTNWVWANKKIFDELNLAVPQTWDEMMAAAEKIKKAGYIPLAHGGQAWQEATMFDGVVLSVGGVDFYRKAMIDLDITALGSKTMEKVFDRMRQLRNLVDDNFPGRDWNLATAMVINGDAAMQIMGDWAKGEFLNADKEPGVDFLCFRMPDTQDFISFNTDQFVMFKVGETGMADQAELAKAIMSPSFQSAFNIVKGSVPARMDVSDEGFDDCGRKAIKDLKAAVKNNTLVGSFGHGHASPANVKNAMYDVITAHFNSQMSSAKAVKRLVKAVETAM